MVFFFFTSLCLCASILIREGVPEERTLMKVVWGLKWVVWEVLKLFLRFSMIFLFDLILFVFFRVVLLPYTREYPWIAY